MPCHIRDQAAPSTSGGLGPPANGQRVSIKDALVRCLGGVSWLEPMARSSSEGDLVQELITSGTARSVAPASKWEWSRAPLKRRNLPLENSIKAFEEKVAGAAKVRYKFSPGSGPAHLCRSISSTPTCPVRLPRGVVATLALCLRLINLRPIRIQGCSITK